MSESKSACKLAWFLGFLLLVPLAHSQGSRPLLRMENVRTELESESNAISNGRNSYQAGLNGSDQTDVQHYPNSATCVVVYEDGRYMVEKRDEHDLSKPKAKSAQGVLSADEMQHLKAILDDQELQKITMPKAIDMPADAQMLVEAVRLDVLVSRGTDSQQFTFMKERLKTAPPTATGASSGSMSGLDTFLDNGAPYKKTVAPLVKWFDEMAKKNKLQSAKPQNCQ